jgi:hypothetical protein
MISFAGVVVHNVEDDLDSGRVQGLDHLFELDDLFSLVAAGAIAGHGREEAEGVVAPVIRESLFDQVAFIDEVVNGK